MGKAMRAAATALPPFNLAALNAEPFFDPYHSLLTVEEFEKFLTLVGQNRASRESRYYVSSGDGKLGCERGRNLRTHTQRSRDADLSKMEIMLVEDVDTRCLMALDANYHLDPQFVLAYADVGDKHSPDLDATADPTDMAGKWYVTEMSMSLDFPWQVGDSRAVKKFSTMDEPWYTNLFRGRHTAGTWLVNPWWGESVREEFDYANTKVRSKIACYCLTDKLRESGQISESLTAKRC